MFSENRSGSVSSVAVGGNARRFVMESLNLSFLILRDTAAIVSTLGVKLIYPARLLVSPQTVSSLLSDNE